MGLSVILEGESGDRMETIHDPINYLHTLLPTPDDETYQCLRFVDWYGDTIFNRVQMECVLRDLGRMRSGARSQEELSLLGEIGRLCERCRQEPHLYVRFSGD